MGGEIAVIAVGRKKISLINIKDGKSIFLVQDLEESTCNLKVETMRPIMIFILHCM